MIYKRRKNNILLFFILIPFFTFGKNPPVVLDNNTNIENQVEAILESTESTELADDTHFETLAFYSKNKIDLNHTNKDELLSLGILNELQVISVLNYIASFGQMKNIWELIGIYGIDKKDIEEILPYVTIKENQEKKYNFKQAITNGKHTLFFRYGQTLQKAKGYQTPDSNTDGTLKSHYLGDRSNLYFRYRYNYKTDISYGITIDKDAGEKVFYKKYKLLGLDYLSGHFYIKNQKWLKYLAVGDYEINYGQGLTCWQSFGLGKSALVNKIKRFSPTIKPHTSANEFNFFRGIGAGFKIKNFEITSFISYKKLDANGIITDTLVNDFGEITSLQTSGLHRTESEILDRRLNHQITTGGSLKWRGKKINIGINGIYNHLSIPLNETPTIYNAYDYKGKNIANISTDYTYMYKKVNIFGEIAFSNNGGFAIINGANIKAVPGVLVSFLHRYYAKNYWQLFANSFGESSNTQNENGIYMGVTLSPFKNTKLETYLDFFTFPWLKYGVNGKSNGFEYYTQITYTPNRKLETYARIKYEQKDQNAPDENAIIDYLVTTKKTNFRLNIAYEIAKNIRLKSRVDMVWQNDGFNKTNKGFSTSQTIAVSTNNQLFTAVGQYSIFQTDNYDTRIYGYESDVLYSFSVPAVSGRGHRYYLLLKYHATKNLDFWLKIGQTLYTDRKVISTSLDEIQGNKKTDIRLQVRIEL